MILTNNDKSRGLILIGWTASRLSDLQFERAAFIAVVGILFVVIMHLVDRRFA